MLKRLFILTAILLFTTFGCKPAPDKKPVTAFVNVNLVPMTSDVAIPGQTVLVKGGQIEAVGPSGEINIPPKAKVIDGAGAWLMPGLADMHMHTKDDWTGPAWPVNPLTLYLANGVTTIRCFGPLGSSPEYVLKWRDEIREGKLAGPAIYTSGPILFAPVPDPEGIVRRQKEKGYDFIKVYSFTTRKEFHEVMQGAKEKGIYTAGHVPFLVGLDGVLAEGMDEIAHIEELDFEFLEINPDMKLSRIDIFKDIIDQAAVKFRSDLKLDDKALEKKHGKNVREVAVRLKGTGMPVCTTLVIAEGIANKFFNAETFLARPENRYLPRAYLETFRIGQEKHQLLFKDHEDLAPFKYNMEKIMAKELKQAGVTLLLGTDSGTGEMGIVPGYSIHDELRILTEVGFTPYEAIKTGTVNASGIIEKMAGKGNFGTIEVGKRADLILVRDNPLRDVANIREPLGVMAAGRWHSEKVLKEMIALDN